MTSKHFWIVQVSLVFLMAAGCLAQPAASSQQIETHLRQAQQFLKDSRPDMAAREYVAILAIDPQNLEAHTNLGVLFYFNSDYAKAIPQLRAALQLRPDVWKTQALLGMAEKRSGALKEARADLETSFANLAQDKLRAETGMQLIELYYASRDLDKAAGVAGVLRQLQPTDPNILYTAHKIFSDQADETLLSLAMTQPDSPRMRQMMGDELARQGQVAGAIENYRAALKADPHLPGVHFRLAEMLNSSNGPTDRQAAQKEYAAALADDPMDARSESRLGEIAFGQSDLKGAAAHFGKAVELQPDDADANLGLAKTLMSMQQMEKAGIYLERAAKLDPYNQAVHFRLAAFYRQAGRVSDADREIAEFRRLKDLKEKLGRVYHDMRLSTGNPPTP
jgi:tetratricopeptide (TPR) repeat protein